MTRIENDWRKVRDQILIEPSIRYFSANSFGLLSRAVYYRLSELRFELAKNPADFLLRQAPDLLWRSRSTLAKFIGTHPERILFTSNASSALSLITSSLKFPAGGHILLTDQEYTTAKWNWQRFSDETGLSVKYFCLPREIRSAEDIIESACMSMTNETRVLFFSHVLSKTGLILPAEELCRKARERGILSVVDGAQAVGLIDLSLPDIGCDFYIGSCHKWLMMPTGSGFIHLGKENEQKLKPLVTSWGYQVPNEEYRDRKDRFGSTPELRQLECEGTRDITPWLVATEAIQFRAEVGSSQFRQRINSLSQYAKNRLSKHGSLSLATPAKQDLHSGLISFWLPSRIDPAWLKSQLWHSCNIEITTSEHNDHSLLRVATHIYNTPSEIDVLENALRDLIQ